MEIYIVPELKECKKCGEIKSIDLFPKCKKTKDGRLTECRDCNRPKRKKYTNKYNNKINAKKSKIKLCARCLIEKENIEFSKGNNNCKECAQIIKKENKEKHHLKEKTKERTYIIVEEKPCKECGKIKSIDCFHKRKYTKDGYMSICTECRSIERKPAAKIYRKKYKKERLEKDKIYRKKRKETDTLYKLKLSIRNNISSALNNKGYSKKSHTYEILGCSYEEFKIHLESLFKDGLSWENRNLWHIDHKVPMAFAETEEECLMLNHYKNLQPMWGTENLEKSDNITENEKTDIYYAILVLRENKINL